MTGITETAATQQSDMVEIMRHPTGEKIMAYNSKHKPKAWKNWTLLQVMVAIYKARALLGIEVKESMKWLHDHDASLDGLELIDPEGKPYADRGDQDV